jgi:hypothetical protein
MNPEYNFEVANNIICCTNLKAYGTYKYQFLLNDDLHLTYWLSYHYSVILAVVTRNPKFVLCVNKGQQMLIVHFSQVNHAYEGSECFTESTQCTSIKHPG